jgi:hypothetical protein
MKNQSSHQNRQPIKHGTTPPRIFIAIQYLEIGGAERSLIGLLNALDYSRCQVDLFVYRHSGEFMNLIPKEVNLLPEVKKYTTLTRPIRKIIREGYWDIAAGRIAAHLLDWCYRKRRKAKESQAIFQYVADCTTPFLPSINEGRTYDLAISFLTPHNIVRDKVKAQQKWAWIHTDYSFIDINTRRELPVWGAFGRIISISESVSKGFLSKFPSLECKLILMENILSETFIREQADRFSIFFFALSGHPFPLRGLYHTLSVCQLRFMFVQVLSECLGMEPELFGGVGYRAGVFSQAPDGFLVFGGYGFHPLFRFPQIKTPFCLAGKSCPFPH